MASVTPLKLTAPDFQRFQTGDFLPFNFGGTGFTSYTDGQLLIGDSSSGALDRSTLTAGTWLSIINGNGSIKINSLDTYSYATLGF